MFSAKHSLMEHALPGEGQLLGRPALYYIHHIEYTPWVVSCFCTFYGKSLDGPSHPHFPRLHLRFNCLVCRPSQMYLMNTSNRLHTYCFVVIGFFELDQGASKFAMILPRHEISRGNRKVIEHDAGGRCKQRKQLRNGSHYQTQQCMHGRQSESKSNHEIEIEISQAGSARCRQCGTLLITRKGFFRSPHCIFEQSEQKMICSDRAE